MRYLLLAALVLGALTVAPTAGATNECPAFAHLARGDGRDLVRRVCDIRAPRLSNVSARSQSLYLPQNVENVFVLLGG